MNNILKTPLYNSLYYDFMNGDKEINKYLPSFKNISWQEKTKSIIDQSLVYKDVKEFIIKDNSDIDSFKGKQNLELLKNNNTAFIITGQQLGLLASPLYTIYKIITSIKLAEQLNLQNLGFNYVPLFWLESEDHDFEEINHFGIWNKSFDPKKLIYQGESKGKASLKHYSFEPKINDLIEQLKSELIPTEFTEKLFDNLNQYYKSGESWLTATRELLIDIFSETGLLFFKPGHPEIKKISVPFFQNILEKSADLNAQFKNVSGELEKEGYSNQVTVLEGKTFLFTENEELQREHIYFENNDFYTKETGIKMSKTELLNLINKDPEKISTSVVSRPLLQSWLLPTAAYVAGPGEIAYWAQIGGMFEKMNLKIPVVFPRISATILEPKIQRYIKKNEIDIENLPKKQNEFIKHILSKSEDNTFSDVKEKLNSELENIKQKMISVDPTMESIFNKTNEKILGQIDFLKHKTLKAKEQKEQSMVSHLSQIHAAFFPDGYPQERYLTFVYYLNKFGPEIFNTIFDNLQLEIFDHQIVDI